MKNKRYYEQSIEKYADSQWLSTNYEERYAGRFPAGYFLSKEKLLNIDK